MWNEEFWLIEEETRLTELVKMRQYLSPVLLRWWAVVSFLLSCHAAGLQGCWAAAAALLFLLRYWPARLPCTASYEVPLSGRLFHIRSGPPHFWTYSNCCKVYSVQMDHSLFICGERSKQNGLHFNYDLTVMTNFSFLKPLRVKIYTLSMFLVIIHRYVISPPCSYLGITSMIHMKFGGIEAW